eukprot:scaffold112461_cov20-Cyclotella_meneghiniana.AAC.1
MVAATRQLTSPHSPHLKSPVSKHKIHSFVLNRSKEGSKEEESNGVRVQRRTRVTVEGDLSADTEYMSWAVDDCKKASYAKRVPKQR